MTSSLTAVALTCAVLVSTVFTLRADDHGPHTYPDGGTVTEEPFGNFDGNVNWLHTLTNKNGVSVSIMDFGATVVRIKTPDKNGKIQDIALGYDHFPGYLTNPPYFGATVGRYANRIAKGQFTLGKTTYHLPINNGPNSLHGGKRGFNKHLWKTEPVDSEIPAVRFTRLSPDGEEGYPGNLYASVTFSLDDQNELQISYEATTDQTTIVNLTNHSYFNLGGGRTILNDLVTIHADSYTPANADLIPTGEIKDVAGTPYDFREPTAIGAHIKELGGKPVGYDLNYVLNKGWFSRSSVAAEVEDPVTGRTVTVTTDQPGLQFYTGNFLDGTLTGKEGKRYTQYSGFALETQDFPDAPNQANFPSAILKPGDKYSTTTTYTFGIK